MKYLKYLVYITILTTIFYGVQVEANSSDPYYIVKDVPSFGGSVSTPFRKKESYDGQQIRYVNIIPQEDTLDVRMERSHYKYGVGTEYSYVGGWKTLKTGEDVIYDNDLGANIVGDGYRLIIKSKLHYIKDTHFAAQWWVH